MRHKTLHLAILSKIPKMHDFNRRNFAAQITNEINGWLRTEEGEGFLKKLGYERKDPNVIKMPKYIWELVKELTPSIPSSIKKSGE